MTAVFVRQCGNGGAAMKAGNHASQKGGGGGSGKSNPVADGVRANLQAFASQDILNRDVLGLAMQGLNDRQIASNLQVGRGTIQARIAAANKILGNDGHTSARALGDSLQQFRRNRSGR